MSDQKDWISAKIMMAGKVGDSHGVLLEMPPEYTRLLAEVLYADIAISIRLMPNDLEKQTAENPPEWKAYCHRCMELRPFDGPCMNPECLG